MRNSLLERMARSEGRLGRLLFAARYSLLAILLAATPVAAQEWPSGTVRVVVPYAAGGPLDLPARLLIDRLAAQTKGTFILEHRAGAGGSIGAQAVAQATPDGSMFLFASSAIAAAPAIYPKLPFDPLEALIPVSLITEFPVSLAVRANSPLRDLPDLIAKAKAQPGKLTYGSGGIGASNHLGPELMKRMAGIDLLHVPFRGVSQAFSALYSGDIDMVFPSSIEALAHVRDGRLRVLGVGGRQRIAELPDVPSISELVPGYVMTNWYGLFAPRGLPAETLARLTAEIAKTRDDPALAQRAAAAGMTMIMSPSEPLRVRMESEVPRWKQLVAEVGIKAE
jgi:tripartite-type tricarboxylate transporter receptor subunit TctC